MSQSILGVSVTVNDSILGLLFVSPQQINAQIPSSLSDGSYTLVVHSTGEPDVSAAFTVSRDAPGLFFQTIGSKQYAIALHADGSVITPESPAAAGETISFLGTGFGPYKGTVLDGFFPTNPAPTVSDTVTISLGSQSPAVIWSGAAVGYTGVTSTKFQVPTGLPSGTSVPLSVSVNGTVSNTVQLPLEQRGWPRGQPVTRTAASSAPIIRATRFQATRTAKRILIRTSSWRRPIRQQ